MIRLLAGVTRKGSRLVYPSDGPFELTAKEEQHLVDTGAAEFITEAPRTGVATPPVDPKAPGTGDKTVSAPEGQETPSSADVPVPTTPLPDTGSDKADVPDGDEDDAMDLPDGVVIVDGHMTVDSLLKMTKNDLLALAADMDLKANDRMTKDTIAILISEVEVSVDGEAGLPELSQEDPTV